MRRFVFRFTKEAEADLPRLIDYRLIRDVDAAQSAEAAIANGVERLEVFAFPCRKTGADARDLFLRELINPCGNSGHLALFEIEAEGSMTLRAMRQQREDDCH